MDAWMSAGLEHTDLALVNPFVPALYDILSTARNILESPKHWGGLEKLYTSVLSQWTTMGTAQNVEAKPK